MLTLRLHEKVLGSHVHVRVFVSSVPAGTGALAGTLVFRTDEWLIVKDALLWGRPDLTVVTVAD